MPLSLHNWALRLLPLHSATLVVAGIGALVSMGLLLGRHDLNTLAIHCSLLLTMWALTLCAFINLFRKPIPLLLPALSWRERMFARCQIGVYYGMTLAFWMLVVGVISFSVKLVIHG